MADTSSFVINGNATLGGGCLPSAGSVMSADVALDKLCSSSG